MNSEAKVGATAIAGLALLVAMVLYLSGVTFGTGTYPVNAVFSHVNGLKTGNTVSYAGVYIGTVRSISILPEGIKVEMFIDSKVKIPEGSKFTITSAGLLGEQYINVIPNNSALEKQAYISPRAIICGEPPYGFDELMQLSSESMQEIKEIVSSINDILGDESVKSSLKETALNINQLTATLSKLTANNQDRIDETVINLALMSESLKDLMERLDGMAAVLDNNGRTARDLRELVGNLNNTSRRVENMAASLEGVVADPQTAQDLKTIISNTKDVSQKANKIVSKTSLKTAVDLEMLYDFKDSKYYSNAYLKIGREESKSFGVIGVSAIGDTNRFNLQYGRDIARWTERMGIIDGKVGVGVDVALGKDGKLSFDVYDPNDVKYKIRAKYQIMPDIALIGQTDRDKDRPSQWHNYWGVQRTF